VNRGWRLTLRRRRTTKARQAGRIQPRLPDLPPPREDECAICGRFPAVVENGRGFCWTHHPERAARLALPLQQRPKWGILIHRPTPDRRTCERILRLAGRTVPAKKPPRPKKRPRDRRYVR
jgi:hypothetical protein